MIGQDFAKKLDWGRKGFLTRIKEDIALRVNNAARVKIRNKYFQY